MTTRLTLYNSALLLCGERFLSALTDSVEARRLLDHVWSDNWVDYCLEQGAWQFAMRTQRIEVDTDFSTPDFGYQNAFTKPTDWILTDAVCSDEYFRTPLLDYADEVGHWFADVDPLYVKFVSNDEDYGGDLSLWPATFADYAAAYGASRIIGSLAGDKAEQMRHLLGPAGSPDRGHLAVSLRRAKNAAARTQPTRFPAEGRWTASRRGAGRRRDGGSSSSLIG